METNPPKRWRHLLVRLGWIFTVVSAVFTWFERGAEWLSGQKIGAFAQAADKVANWYGALPVLGAEKFQTYSGVAAAIAFVGTICLWVADRFVFRNHAKGESKGVPAIVPLAFSTDPEAVAKREQAMNRVREGAATAAQLAQEMREVPHLPTPELKEPTVPQPKSAAERLHDHLWEARARVGGVSGAKSLIERRIAELPEFSGRRFDTWPNWLDATEALFTGLIKARFKNTWIEYLRAIPYPGGIRWPLSRSKPPSGLLEGDCQ